MLRKSITRRLAALYCLVASVVLIALGLYLQTAVALHFEESDLTELRGKLELTASLLEQVTSAADLDRLPAQLDAALVGHHNLSILVSRASGEQIFASSSATYPGSPVAPTPAASIADVRPVVWQNADGMYRGIAAHLPVGIAGEPPATVVAALEIGHHHEFLAEFRRAQWTATILAIALMTLLGWWVARRGMSPLHDMSARARGVSAEQLNTRFDLATLPVELVALAAAFNDMLARLEHAFRRLSEFSSDIAHELRTPISNLMTQTHVSLSQARSAENYREILYSSLEEYERLARMVSDMLFLAKADDGQMIARRERVDLAATVRELYDFYGALAEERGVGLDLQGTGGVAGDRLMLRRALANLLSNGIRHTPAGGALHTRIADNGQGWLALRISNPGSPIPAEHLPRLFDRFYRVDASRRRETEGAGLGLAITKAIVEAHGGHIGVTSDSASTCFSIELPPL